MNLLNAPSENDQTNKSDRVRIESVRSLIQMPERMERHQTSMTDQDSSLQCRAARMARVMARVVADTNPVIEKSFIYYPQTRGKRSADFCC